jgi:hypothetical protein
MLKSGRIPMSPEEIAAIDGLLADHPDGSAAMTRTEPNNTGPIRLEIGRKAWLVSEAGVAKEVT